jgi:hypothetical protein
VIRQEKVSLRKKENSGICYYSSGDVVMITMMISEIKNVTLVGSCLIISYPN